MLFKVNYLLKSELHADSKHVVFKVLVKAIEVCAGFIAHNIVVKHELTIVVEVIIITNAQHCVF